MVRGVMVSSQMNISENKISKLEEISKEWPGRKTENQKIEKRNEERQKVKFQQQPNVIFRKRKQKNKWGSTVFTSRN